MTTDELLRHADNLLKTFEISRAYNEGYSDGLKAAIEAIRSNYERR